MTERITAVLALLILGAFLAVMVVRVPETDLMIVLGICFLLAVADVVVTLLRRRRTPGAGDAAGPKGSSR